VKPALLGGQVDVMIEALSSGLALHQGGQAKILAIAAANRSAVAPDVPTVDEALGTRVRGHPLERRRGAGGTPSAIVEALSAATAKVLKDPSMQAQLSRLAMESMDLTPAASTEFIKSEMRSGNPSSRPPGSRSNSRLEQRVASTRTGGCFAWMHGYNAFPRIPHPYRGAWTITSSKPGA